MHLLEIIFWVLIAYPLYAMLGYPLLVFVLSKVLRRKFVREPITPTVSLIIAAYNEEKAIAAKLENSLALDSPRDKLEIIVALSPDMNSGVVSGGSQKRG